MYKAVFAARFDFFLPLFSSGQPSSWVMLEKILGRMQLLPLPLLKSPQWWNLINDAFTWGRVLLWLRRRFHVLKGKKLLLLYWLGVSPELSRRFLERYSVLYWGSENKVQDWGFFLFFFFLPKMSALADIHYNSLFYKAIIWFSLPYRCIYSSLYIDSFWYTWDKAGEQSLQ